MIHDIKTLETRIGYTFSDHALLVRALTHTSYANEHMGSRDGSNERLEFLGDSVLSLIVCKYLYTAYPTLPEGKLTAIKIHRSKECLKGILKQLWLFPSVLFLTLTKQ